MASKFITKSQSPGARMLLGEVYTVGSAKVISGSFPIADPE